MIKLGQTTTGDHKGVKYLWLVKNMSIYRNYDKKRCYVVMAFAGRGWWSMFNGTLRECRRYMSGGAIIDI